MEDILWLLMTAGVQLVGVLYMIALAVQLVCGWPDRPGYMRHIEALKPRRICRMTLALLDLLKYLKYIRLYLHIITWYKSKESTKYFEKGITFGRRGKKLDLYHPPKRDSSEHPPVPLMVFVYGGAWSSGSRSTYCLLARQMAEELNVVVLCPDYSTYPQGNVLGMVQDIADCLIWASENGQKFNYDKDNIVLIGHSAGGHLCVLTVLFLIDTREELNVELQKQQAIAHAIKGVIGLSGVYDISDHYQHEKNRGIEYVSCMCRAMNGVENFPYYSPTWVVKRFSREKLNRLPPFAFLHGSNDIVVPPESSRKILQLLTDLSVKASLHLLPGISHTDIVTDLMLSNRSLYHRIYNHIKEEYYKLVGGT